MRPQFPNWHYSCCKEISKCLKGKTRTTRNVNLARGIAAMLSRKEFFKDLLFRGIRAVGDLSGGCEGGSAEPAGPVCGFDLPATELSPSLLAIEAELRGVRLEAGKAEELQLEIYRELAQTRPIEGADELQ